MYISTCLNRSEQSFPDKVTLPGICSKFITYNNVHLINLTVVVSTHFIVYLEFFYSRILGPEIIKQRQDQVALIYVYECIYLILLEIILRVKVFSRLTNIQS